jgi:hypothetical protein
MLVTLVSPVCPATADLNKKNRKRLESIPHHSIGGALVTGCQCRINERLTPLAVSLNMPDIEYGVAYRERNGRTKTANNITREKTVSVRFDLMLQPTVTYLSAR